VEFFVSDYVHPPLKNPKIQWSFRVNGSRVTGGQLSWSHEPCRTVSAGAGTFKAPAGRSPQRAKHCAELRDGNRRVPNAWDLWIFPKKVALPKGTLRSAARRHTWLQARKDLPVATARELRASQRPQVVLAERMSQALVMHSGGRVLLAASKGIVRPMNPKLGLTRGAID